MTNRGYKLCSECGQPVLKKGQQRQHPDDYRHARGCPNENLDAAPPQPEEGEG